MLRNADKTDFILKKSVLSALENQRNPRSIRRVKPFENQSNIKCFNPTNLLNFNTLKFNIVKLN